MDAAFVLNIVPPIVFIIVGIVLIWFLVEMARTVKTTRQVVDDLQNKVNPTLDHVNQITNDLQPAVTKVDPMMERLALTVDAVNLELMRVDQILEDVNDVTGNLSKTSNAIDNVTSAPLNLVNNMTERVRGALKSSRSSSEAAALAEAAAEETQASQDTGVSDATHVVAPLQTTDDVVPFSPEDLHAVDGDGETAPAYAKNPDDQDTGVLDPIDTGYFTYGNDVTGSADATPSTDGAAGVNDAPKDVLL